MKTIGLIKIINNTVKNKLGGLHSSKCILYSVDFHEVEALQSMGKWEKVAEIIFIGNKIHYGA
jgi:aspartate racemase